MTLATEIQQARTLGENLENLVVERDQFPNNDRNILLLAHWSLLFDHLKAILNNIENGWKGSAAALVRPVIESLVRAHVAVRGSEDDIRRLQQDEYRTNLALVGPWIDREFGTANLFENFLNEKARKALHGYTHGGIAQIARRFNGNDLQAHYEDGEMVEVVRVCTSAAWLVTNLVTKYLGFEQEADAAEALYLKWGRRPLNNLEPPGIA